MLKKYLLKVNNNNIRRISVDTNLVSPMLTLNMHLYTATACFSVSGLSQNIK